jgi:hypothetical protein
MDDLRLVVPFPPETTAEIDEGQRRSLQQLAAVRSLLSVEAQADRHDILITTAFEALAEGPKSEPDLVVFCEGVWPGAGIDASRVDAAMRVAQHASYVTQVSITGELKWALTEATQREVLTSKNWAKEIFESTAAQVRGELADAGRNVSAEEARLWAMNLQRGLMAAARGLAAPYEGDVVARGAAGLAARRWDEKALRRVLMESAATEDDASLLIALSLDALDSNKAFGNDMVSCITVGYVLHAIMGGRDRVADLRVLGSVHGDRAILDTPILCQLLGTRAQAEPIERLIAAARRAGMEVIALDHYLEELRELVARIETDNPDIAHYRPGAEDQAGVAGWIISDDVASAWLAAVGEGRYSDWSDFRGTVASLGAHLQSIGVVVRPHGNGHRDDVDACERALLRDVESRGGHRTPQAARRDAETMAMALRTRKRRPPRTFFPGAWVVTPDSHMGPAYGQMTGDEIPLAITPVAWLTIVSNCAPAAEAWELVNAAAAPLLREETFMTVAGRFPAKTAMKLAQTLGPANGGSYLDIRIAQMSFGDLLRTSSNLDDGANELTAKIVTEVMRKRTQRLNLSYTDATARHEALAERMAAAYREERQERQRERERADRAEADRANALGYSRETSAAIALAAKLGERRARSYGMLVGLVVAGSGLALAGAFAAAFLVFASVLVFWKLSNDWVADPDATWTKLLPAALIDAAALLGWIFRWPF